MQTNDGTTGVTLEMIKNPRLRAWLAANEPETLRRALEALGYHLMHKGSTSVARLNVPRFADAVTFAANVPAWMKEEFKVFYDVRSRQSWLRLYGDVIELEPQEMAAFLGRKVA